MNMVWLQIMKSQELSVINIKTETLDTIKAFEVSLIHFPKKTRFSGDYSWLFTISLWNRAIEIQLGEREWE